MYKEMFTNLNGDIINIGLIFFIFIVLATSLNLLLKYIKYIKEEH